MKHNQSYLIFLNIKYRFSKLKIAFRYFFLQILFRTFIYHVFKKLDLKKNRKSIEFFIQDIFERIQLYLIEINEYIHGKATRVNFVNRIAMLPH